MSFLDNLENSLKSLENGSERDDADREKTMRAKEVAAQRAAAPWAERLKNSPFSAGLMNAATRAGFQMRTKVHITWLGATLRMDARDRRLELRPAPEGIVAIFSTDLAETAQKLIDLNSDPAELARQWLS